MQNSVRWVLPVASVSRLRKKAVDEPGRGGAALAAVAVELAEGEFQLEEGVVPRLIDARVLAGGTDEEAAEQVAEAGVIVPVTEQRLEQIGPAQEGRFARGFPADDDVVAAAGTGVAAVDQKLFRAEPGEPGLLVEGGRVIGEFAPGFHRVHVDLDDAGIGGDLEDVQARVVGRWRALKQDGQLQRGGDLLDGGDQVEEVLGGGDRRQEEVESAAARFDAEGGAQQPGRGFLRFRWALCVCLVGRQPAPLGPALAEEAIETGAGGRLGRLAADGIWDAWSRLRRRWQVGPVVERVLRVNPRVIRLTDPGQAVERQTQAHGRIAGDQVQGVIAHEPRTTAPAEAVAAPAAFERQDETDDVIESLLEDLRQAGAFLGIAQVRLEGIDIDRQALLPPEVVIHVLVGGLEPAFADAERLRQGQSEGARLGFAVAEIDRFIGDQVDVVPDRHAVLAPVAGERPARQRFAGVPLALAVVEQAAGGEARAQALEQRAGEQTLRGTDRGGVPLGAIHVVHADKGGFATHRQAHVADGQAGVDLMAERVDGRPLLRRVGQGDARGFEHAFDVHLVVELHLAGIDEAADRCGADRIGRGGERQVALAGQQARGGIEADPAGPGQVDLAPGMQVGEVTFRAGRTVERFHIGLELDQVAADKARGETQMTEELHEQPGGVATGTAGELEGLFRRLHAGLEPDRVADLLGESRIELHEEIHRARATRVLEEPGLTGWFGQDAMRMRVGGFRVGHRRVGQSAAEQVVADLPQQGREARRGGQATVKGFEFVREGGVVPEGEVLGLGFQEEVEGIEHRHLGDEIDLDAEFAGGFGKDEAGEVVRLRILLPVEEVFFGRDLQRVAEHRRAAVRGGAQPHHVRGKAHRPVELVACEVAESDVDGHAAWPITEHGPCQCRGGNPSRLRDAAVSTAGGTGRRRRGRPREAPAGTRSASRGRSS